MPVRPRLNAAFRQWLDTVVWLVEFEPTWFPEFGFALGALGWGVGSVLTDDYDVQGWAYVLPALAIVGGLFRSLALVRLWYGWRVIMAALSAFLVAWLWWGLAGHFGIVPMMGWLAGVFVTEVLTMAKFSIRCMRELAGKAAI